MSVFLSSTLAHWSVVQNKDRKLKIILPSLSSSESVVRWTTMKIPIHRCAEDVPQNLTRSEKILDGNEKTYFYVFVCSNEKLENHSRTINWELFFDVMISRDDSAQIFPAMTSGYTRTFVMAIKSLCGAARLRFFLFSFNCSANILNRPSTVCRCKKLKRVKKV